MNASPSKLALLKGPVIAMLGLLSLEAGAEVAIHVEAGGSLPLTAPQKTYFGTGLGLQAGAAIGLLPMLDLEVALGYSVWPPASGSVRTSPASLINTGVMVRAKRPLPGAQLVPWVDGGGFYTRTGTLNQAGATGAVGVLFRTTERSSLLFGVAVRYQRVLALSDEPGYLKNDVDLLTVGLAIEFLTSDPPRRIEVVPPPPPGPTGPSGPTGAAPPDADGDGLPDLTDRCPMQGGTDANRGCPDADGDGVVDRDDKCPDTAGFPTAQGCPDEDPDKDGIKGAADLCPNAPGPAKTSGCPDSDGDSVPDSKDECPKAAGPVKMNGCPDMDGDKLADNRDLCPLAVGRPEDLGCPKYKHVTVSETTLELKAKVAFAFAKAKIMPNSNEQLDELAQAIKDRGVCLRLQAPSDNKGPATADLKLSMARGDAVKDHLLKKGVEAGRLLVAGSTAGPEAKGRVALIIVKCGGAQ